MLHEGLPTGTEHTRSAASIISWTHTHARAESCDVLIKKRRPRIHYAAHGVLYVIPVRVAVVEKTPLYPPG